MSDVILIYLLIGLAHWAGHVMTCRGCQKAVASFGVVVLEGVIKTFGWPIQLAGYIREMRRQSLPKNMRVVELRQNPGESMADFMNRAAEIAKEEVGKGPQS